MIPFSTLIEKCQFKKSPNIGAIADQRYENRDIRGVVLHTLTIGIEIDSPFVPTNKKRIGCNVFPNSHTFIEGVPIDLKIMRNINGLESSGRGGDR